uniref:Uncharacterized protein n=1 Tax=Heterorhabditis bacteriophora TaxID=37862 RepID=A0A1I7W7X6_HETBA
MNTNCRLRRMCVKRIWSDDEHQRLEEIVKAEYQKAIELNEKNIMKIREICRSIKGISDTSYEWTCGILVTTDLLFIMHQNCKQKNNMT